MGATMAAAAARLACRSGESSAANRGARRAAAPLFSRRRRLRHACAAAPASLRRSIRLPDPFYHWRRLSARLHRLALARHARGWGGLLRRLRDGHGHPDEAGPAPQAPAAAAAPPSPPAPKRRRILVIDVSTPRPDRDSGSVRAFNLLRALRQAGHAVDFLPDDRVDAGRHASALRALGVGVRDDAGPYPRWLARHAAGYDAFVVCRYHLAEFLLPLLRRLRPGALLVLDTVDLHHLRESREASLRGDRRLARLARGTRRRELAAIAAADTTWVVSEAERALLARELPAARVDVVANVHEAAADAPGFDARRDLLFLGGARHPPNVDAARWLAADLFPRIAALLPGCQLHLVGEGLPQAIADLSPPPGLVAHGHVPDIGPLLSGCRVGLAPLRFGAGVKGKVNACMAAGMPVVATACAAEGMHLRDGRDVLLADDADAYAAAVAAVYRDPALWAALSAAGLDNVRRHFSFDAARAALAATFGDAPPPHAAPAPDGAPGAAREDAR